LRVAQFLPLEGSAYRYDTDWLDSAYTATAHPTLENDLGRIRHVSQNPAGTMYALTSNRDGRASSDFHGRRTTFSSRSPLHNYRDAHAEA